MSRILAVGMKARRVLELKGLNPAGKLPSGILAGGKPSIEECESCVKMLQLRRWRRRRRFGDCAKVGERFACGGGCCLLDVSFHSCLQLSKASSRATKSRVSRKRKCSILSTSECRRQKANRSAARPQAQARRPAPRRRTHDIKAAAAPRRPQITPHPQITPT